MNLTGTEFEADGGGVWHIEVSGPATFEDNHIAYNILQNYIADSNYGFMGVLTYHSRTTYQTTSKSFTVNLTAHRTTIDPDPDVTTGGGGCGMAVASLNRNNPAVHLSDLPLTYVPAYGPAPSFQVIYSDNSPTMPEIEDPPTASSPPVESLPLGPFEDYINMPKAVDPSLVTHLGEGWGMRLLSYVQGGIADATETVNPGIDAYYFEPGLGKERFSEFQAYGGVTPYGTIFQEETVYPPQTPSRARLTYKSSGDGSYERVLPDGTKQVFGKIVVDGDGYKIFFITSLTDPQGNTMTYGYEADDDFARLTSITDATGKITRFFYEDGGDLQRLTKITDPFGRSVVFDYDGSERLESITDPVGIVSEFSYDGDGRISQLTTPYGDTTFERDFANGWRMAQITLPDGSKERAEYFEKVDDDLTPVGGAPSGTGLLIQQTNLNKNVSFYWSRKAMAEAAQDSADPLSDDSYAFATQTQWLQIMGLPTATPSSVKAYGQNRIWMNYKSTTNTVFQQATDDFQALLAPVAVAQLTEAGSEITRNEYNAMGNVVSSKDALGRERVFSYDPSGIDLLKVSHKVGGTYKTLSSFVYDFYHPHKVEKATDAAGQTTRFLYNAAGQPIRITNSKNEVTILDYTKEGYLEKVTKPLGYVTSMTWDKGMPRTTTNSEGLTTTSAYDKLDRLLRTSWPDGTSEVITYDKLDAKTFKDRENKVTTWNYNSIRQKTEEIDPLGRSTLFEWCRCGSLQKLTDAAGNITQWDYDAGARLLSKTYDDSKQDLYTYQSQSGRLNTLTDAESRVKTYTYKLDGSLDTVAYSGDSDLTPDVSFAYDSSFARVTSMTDGTGVTSYSYKAVGSLGALGLDTESKTGASGFSSYSTSLTYDELGRVVEKSINGSAQTVTYDALGRASSWTNALGTFGATFVSGTGKPLVITYPNDQTTTYSYHDNNQKGEDFRLAGILNETSGNSLLSEFNYQYNPSGSIKTWTQTAGADPAKQWKFSYDKADQLVSGTLALSASPYTISSQLSYTYDEAGNRKSQKSGSAAKNAVYNNLNQITSQDAGGSMKFKGQTTEPAYVTVQSGSNPAVAATNEASNGFSAVVPVDVGTNTITVVATDTSPNANVKTKQYEVDVDASSTQTFTYDDVGNMLSDGSKSFLWDAENRLIKITYSDSTSTEFYYDGMSRRVKTLEKNSGGTVTSEKRFVWSGGYQPAEERNSSNTTIVRYFAHGEKIPAASSPADKLFYTKDHLGSVKELVDNDEVVRARYSYDLWGNAAKVSGDLDTVVGYTSHQLHVKSGSLQTHYRIYRPDLGRWLSRDPISESGGINLYGYTYNNPINAVDPDGLDVFFAEDGKIHGWVQVGGKKIFSDSGTTIGFYPYNDVVSPDETAARKPPETSYEQYQTTPEEEWELLDYIAANYDVNGKQNPDWIPFINDCHDFSADVEQALKEILRKNGHVKERKGKGTSTTVEYPVTKYDYTKDKQKSRGKK